MDFFNCRYYWWNRKLLLLIGQWPFQNQSVRLIKLIFICAVVLSVTTVQVAKLMTSQLTLNMVAEIVSIQISIVICILKYFTYTIQTKKIKLLLQRIVSDWNCLTDDGDRKVAEKCAEDGRKYIFLLSVSLYLCGTVAIIPFALQPLLDVVAPKNETRERMLIYPAEYFVDQQKYFCPILLYMTVTVFVAITVLLATDTIRQLEHAFDKYKPDEACKNSGIKETRIRIANAVECHQTVIQFVDLLVSTFEILLFLEIGLVFCNITITLYWAAVSVGKLGEMMLALLYGIVQMFLTLVVAYPCQKVIDDSSAIPFKAYCAVWYNAPFELQTLIVPIIHRGSKPTMISVAKMAVITLEFYAKAIQLSMSYFMVLLSFV